MLVQLLHVRVKPMTIVGRGGRKSARVTTRLFVLKLA